jgi:serine/threonine protein kinase
MDNISIISTGPPQWGHWHPRGSHVDFTSDEQPQLQEVRCLGSGASAYVYETRCQGIALACKRMYCRNNDAIGKRRQEAEILKKLSHLHIIQLVGTYTHQNFLGLLLWPVAICDLTTFLKDLDGLKEFSATNGDFDAEALDRLQRLNISSMEEGIKELVDNSQRRIFQSFSCLTGAIAYLHSQKIRHKDLKPSNILLFENNILLSDFGISTDFSALSNSETDHGARGTSRYFAPEVARFEANGRKADIFSLGCIFLEVFWAATTDQTMAQFDALLLGEGNGTFHENLEHIWIWCSGEHGYSVAVRRLLLEIKHMLNRSPTSRPSAREIEEFLTVGNGLREEWDWSFHAPCCAPSANEVELLKTEIDHLKTLLYADTSSYPSTAASVHDGELQTVPTDFFSRIGLRRFRSGASLAPSTLSTSSYVKSESKQEPYVAHLQRVRRVRGDPKKTIDVEDERPLKRMSIFAKWRRP